jgi:tetratricopeptide (TPR) repeat protein
MPEKSQNEISPAWRELYDKGRAALQRQNLDYAINLFNQILQKEPAFYDCREALRAAQFKKAGSGGGFFKRALGTVSSQPLLAKGRLALRNSPAEAMHIAEQILNTDPQNSMAHHLLADAALAGDFPRTAVLSLEILFKTAPTDKHLAMKLGNALTLAGQIAKAESIYSELLRLDPDNLDIAQALKDLSARRTMQEGGYDSLADGQGSYRDILRDKEEAVALEQEQREVKAADVAQNLIQEYEARLPDEPNNLKLLRSLAELCAQKSDFDRALTYYLRMKEVTLGSDPTLEKVISETTVKKYDQALEALDPQAPDHAERADRIKAERQDYQLNECRSRAEKYSTDLQIRFELGLLYFRAGKIGEAIQELQKAQANPHRRVQALYYLGQCFARRGMFDLASRSLQNAIKEKAVFDDEKKELLYALGCTFEKMKRPDEAIEQFKLIYEVDIGYKDVAAKVDAYYASQQ